MIDARHGDSNLVDFYQGVSDSGNAVWRRVLIDTGPRDTIKAEAASQIVIAQHRLIALQTVPRGAQAAAANVPRLREFQVPIPRPKYA